MHKSVSNKKLTPFYPCSDILWISICDLKELAWLPAFGGMFQKNKNLHYSYQVLPPQFLGENSSPPQNTQKTPFLNTFFSLSLDILTSFPSSDFPVPLFFRPTVFLFLFFSYIWKLSFQKYSYYFWLSEKWKNQLLIVICLSRKRLLQLTFWST